MSAVLVDDLVEASGVGVVPAGCAEVIRFPVADCAAATVVVPSSEAGRQWHLTQRGLVVVMAAFIGLVVTGFAAVVTSFLAVSNEPLSGSQSAAVGSSVARLR